MCGESWNEGFNRNSSRAYEGITSKRSVDLLSRLLRRTGNWADTIRRSIAVLVLETVYDWSPQDSRTDKLIRRIDEFMEHLLNAALPGAFLVETFPWMLYLPESIAKWKRDGMKNFRIDTEMFEGLLHSVKVKIVSFIAERRSYSYLADPAHRRADGQIRVLG